MKKTNRFCIIWLFNAIIVFLLNGCVPGVSPSPPISTSILIAYTTLTPIPPSASPTLTVTKIPVPTPTSISYPIAHGDTLNAIAKRFGISLNVLLAANPGIAPQALTVGQVIIIPSGLSVADSTLISTPTPLDIGNILCLPSGGGIACLIPLHNPYPDALENVKVHIVLLGEGDQTLVEQDAILPLNILPPGQILPAQAFFKGVTSVHSSQAQLLSSIRLLPGDPRYLKNTLQNTLVSIAWDGLSANVNGQIMIAPGERSTSEIWLVTVAYDPAGQIVGYSRWEWTGSLQPGNSLPFLTTVYSLGPPIDHVEVLAEARP